MKVTSACLLTVLGGHLTTLPIGKHQVLMEELKLNCNNRGHQQRPISNVTGLTKAHQQQARHHWPYAKAEGRREGGGDSILRAALQPESKAQANVSPPFIHVMYGFRPHDSDILECSHTHTHPMTETCPRVLTRQHQ